MKKYAEMLGDTVQCVFEASVAPVYAVPRYAVDVTHEIPVPAGGWKRMADGTFYEPVPPVQVRLGVEISVSGGDGDDPPGIEADGFDHLDFTATIRNLDTGDIAPVSGNWRILVRDIDGNIRDVVRLSLSGGVASVAYSTPNPNYYVIDGKDFLPVPLAPGISATVHLEKNIEFKAYRTPKKPVY